MNFFSELGKGTGQQNIKKQLLENMFYLLVMKTSEEQLAIEYVLL